MDGNEWLRGVRMKKVGERIEPPSKIRLAAGG